MNLSALLFILFLIVIMIALFIFKIINLKNKIEKLKKNIVSKNKVIEEKDDFLKNQQEKIEILNNNIKEKLKKARNIHEKMLPDKLAEPEDFFISDYYQPAEYIGGDYYNVFKIDHGAMEPFFDQYLIYFFDVSGHGIDSTLLSIFVNDCIANYFKLKHNPGEMISTKELMNYIDQQYQEEGFPDDYLVCLFIAVLDKKKQQLIYSSGGFQYPIYKIKNDQIEEINIGGLPISTALGALKDSRKQEKIPVEKDTTLVSSTDGLLEQRREDKVYFNQFKKVLKDYKFLPAPFLRDLICSDFYNFTNNKAGEDDITFLLMQRPEGEIYNYNFEAKNIDKLESELNDFLNQNQWGNYSKFEEIKEITLKIFSQIKSDLKVKALNNSKLLMIALENESKKAEWEQIINDYPNLTSIADKKLEDIKGEEQKINFSLDELYFSFNKTKKRIYLLFFKK